MIVLVSGTLARSTKLIRLQSLTIIDAETLVLKTLKQVMEEKLDSKNVQLASVTKEKGFRIYTDEEMAAVVERLPAN